MVAGIPDGMFRSTKIIPSGMYMCEECLLKSVIRRTTQIKGHDYPRYRNYFIKNRLTSHYLNDLLKVHDLQFSLEDDGTMHVLCDEDEWKIFVDATGGVQLYHNNYFRWGDCDRMITKGFHQQRFRGHTVKNAMDYITAYVWADHVEKPTSNTLSYTITDLGRVCPNINEINP